MGGGRKQSYFRITEMLHLYLPLQLPLGYKFQCFFYGQKQNHNSLPMVTAIITFPWQTQFSRISHNTAI